MRTVLVVDDHEGFRSAVLAILESAGLRVVGEAATGIEALEATVRLRPAVVLLDVLLPDVDGFAVARELAAATPRPDVVLVSSHDARTFGARVETAPVRGFMTKSELSGAALRALLG